MWSKIFNEELAIILHLYITQKRLFKKDAFFLLKNTFLTS
ncbi:hypothetical protein TASCI_90010 [Tenacibaculum ascidiaceicola]